MGTAAKPTRENRTITVDFRDEATYFQPAWRRQGVSRMCPRLPPGPRLSAQTQGDLSRGRVPDAPLPLCPCPSGWGHHLAYPVHDVQSRVHGPPPLRLALSPDATGGGPRCPVGHAWGPQFGAVRGHLHISPMALYRLVCAFGHQSLVTVLTRCGLPLPVYFLADEKHSHCLTEKVYLPTIVRGRVIWHLGYTEEASAAAFTQSYQEFQRAASQQEPSYRVRGSSPMASTAPPRVCGRSSLERAWATACATRSTSSRRNSRPSRRLSARPCARSSTPCCTGRASGRACGCLRWASGYATLPTTSPPRLGWPMARVRRWFQDKKAGWYAVLADPQMPVTSTLLDQAHNAIERKLFAMKGFHHPHGEPTGVSHGAGTPVQPGPVSASGPACRPVWGGSRRRNRPHTRLVPQPAPRKSHPVRAIGLSWAKNLPSNSANVDKTLARRCP